MSRIVLTVSIAVLVTGACKSTPDTPGGSTTTQPVASCSTARVATELGEELEEIKGRLAPLQAAMETATGEAEVEARTIAYVQALKQDYERLGSLGKQAEVVADGASADLRVDCLVMAADAAMLQAYLPISERPNPDVYPTDMALARARPATLLCAGLSMRDVGPLLPERCALAHTIEAGAPLIRTQRVVSEALSGSAPTSTAQNWQDLTNTMRGYTASLASVKEKREAIGSFAPGKDFKEVGFTMAYLVRPVCNVRFEGRRLLDLFDFVPEGDAKDNWAVYSEVYADAVSATNAAFEIQISDDGKSACQAEGDDPEHAQLCRRANGDALFNYCEAL